MKNKLNIVMTEIINDFCIYLLAQLWERIRLRLSIQITLAMMITSSTIKTQKPRIIHHQICSGSLAGGIGDIVGVGSGGLVVEGTVVLLHSDQLMAELRMWINWMPSTLCEFV